LHEKQKIKAAICWCSSSYFLENNRVWFFWWFCYNVLWSFNVGE